MPKIQKQSDALFAGVRCITPITHESLGMGPVNLKRLLRFNLVCTVAVRVAVTVCCHPRFVFGVDEFTGRR